MNKTIKELTVTELKALVYDNMGTIEQAKNNINIINQEIAERAKSTPTEAPVVPEVIEEK